MRQDEIRGVFSFELLEEIFYFGPYIGEIAVSKFLDDDLLSSRVCQEQVCTLDRFRPPLPGCSKHDPNYFRSGVFIKQSQNCAPATDFDVIAMCSQAQNPEDRITLPCKL